MGAPQPGLSCASGWASPALLLRGQTFLIQGPTSCFARYRKRDSRAIGMGNIIGRWKSRRGDSSGVIPVCCLRRWPASLP